MSKFKETILKAFFHDPIHKALVLAVRKKHEDVAKQLAFEFGISLTDEDIKNLKSMDVLASATERLALPQNADKDPKFQVRNLNELIFRHPLSGKEFHLNLSKDSFQHADNILKETLRDFSSKTKGKDELQKLSFLWHNLLNELVKQDPEFPWNLLPADTRVPDHSIWDHLKLTTATKIEWIDKSPYATGSIFIFTLGPVQSFIKKARKAQDFWAGSFILSFLTFKAIMEVVNTYGPTVIIYPDLQAHPWILQNNPQELTIPTIPNRFVALLPEIDEEKLREIGHKCEDAVKNQLNNWAIKIQKILNLNNHPEIETTFKRQLESAFATYWVALKLPTHQNGKKDYQTALELIKKTLSEERSKRAEKLAELMGSEETLYEPNVGAFFGHLYSYTEKALASRKSIRDKLFGEPEPGNSEKADKISRVERCHICGERNAIVVRRRPDKNSPPVFLYYSEKDFKWDEINPQPEVGKRELPENEALCGVCLIKRFFPKLITDDMKGFPKELSFPSVADIATADFEEKILDEAEFHKEYQNFESKLIELVDKSLEDELKRTLHSEQPTELLGESLEAEKVLDVTPIPLIRQKSSKFLEGEWFFEASLQKEVVERTLEIKIESPNREAVLKEAQKRLRDLIEIVGRSPCPYYAFIAIDGDNMGKWLAGEIGFPLDENTNIYHPKVWRNLPEEFKNRLIEIFKISDDKWYRPVTPAFHASLAKALQTFALKIVPQIVENQHLGKLIYAGGDDVLAFVNLKDLWDVLLLLRAGYSGMIKIENGEIHIDKTNQTGIVKVPGKGYWLTMGPTATLSAGVVIAHYKTPLSVVISQGFSMESRAKETLGRDAFSITWLKHSGEIVVSGGKWRLNENDDDLITRLQKVSKHFVSKNTPKLSRRFLKELKGLAEKLLPMDSKPDDGIIEIFKPLIGRAVKRHIEPKTAGREKINGIYTDLENLLNAMENDIYSFLNLIEIGLLYQRFSNPE